MQNSHPEPLGTSIINKPNHKEEPKIRFHCWVNRWQNYTYQTAKTNIVRIRNDTKLSPQISSNKPIPLFPTANLIETDY